MRSSWRRIFGHNYNRDEKYESDLLRLMHESTYQCTIVVVIFGLQFCIE